MTMLWVYVILKEIKSIECLMSAWMNEMENEAEEEDTEKNKIS